MTTSNSTGHDIKEMNCSLQTSYALETPLQVGEAKTVTADPGLSFGQVYEREVKFVWRNLSRLGVPQDRLHDAAQDVFLVVFRRLSSFDGRSLRSWLYAIVLHVSQGYARTSRRKDIVDKTDPDRVVNAGRSPCDEAERGEGLRVAQQLLNTLSAEKRQTFLLVELEQMSVQEVAAALGVSIFTVYSRLRSARREFEKAIERREMSSGRPA